VTDGVVEDATTGGSVVGGLVGGHGGCTHPFADGAIVVFLDVITAGYWTCQLHVRCLTSFQWIQFALRILCCCEFDSSGC